MLKKITTALVAAGTLALAAPAVFACPGMDHDQAPKTVDKDQAPQAPKVADKSKAPADKPAQAPKAKPAPKVAGGTTAKAGDKIAHR